MREHPTKARASGPLITVIICTQNRAGLLRGAVASVVEQNFTKSDYELLVVDNASTDSTRDVVAEFQDAANVRYLYEEQPGLCIARNTGWRAAFGQYVAFFDDDAIAMPGWLQAVKDGFEAEPQSGVVGGRVRPLWEQRRPDWLMDSIAGSLTIVDWGPSAKLIEDIRSEWLVGANMAIPKTILEEVGGFHPWLDRVGKNLLSSGDVFLQKEIMRRGYRCFYFPAMAIQHLVPASRLERRWFLRRFYWQGVSDAVVHLIEERPSLPRRLRLALVRAGAVLCSRRKLRSLLLPAAAPDAFTAKCLALIQIGFIAGLLGAARH